MRGARLAMRAPNGRTFPPCRACSKIRRVSGLSPVSELGRARPGNRVLSESRIRKLWVWAVAMLIASSPHAAERAASFPGQRSEGGESAGSAERRWLLKGVSDCGCQGSSYREAALLLARTATTARVVAVRLSFYRRFGGGR